MNLPRPNVQKGRTRDERAEIARRVELYADSVTRFGVINWLPRADPLPDGLTGVRAGDKRSWGDC